MVARNRRNSDRSRSRERDDSFMEDWSGMDAESKGGFDIFSFNLRNPLEATSKGLLWWFVVIPAGVAFIWGVYNPNNLSSVFGIATRRGTGAFIEETKPVGNSLLNGTQTGRFTPEGNSLQQQSDTSIRPGAAEPAVDTGNEDGLYR